MFEHLYDLARRAGGSLTLALSLADGDRLNVVVMPKPVAGKDSDPALSMPLAVCATAAELDEGFVPALLSYSASRTSLQDQVAATNEVLAAAKEAQVQKGAKATSKAATKTTAKPAAAAALASASEDDDTDDDGEDSDAADAEGANATVPAATAATGAADAQGPGFVPQLFG